ncbi:AAA-like domain-containing protein [Gloeothece verrucosa]|uniref:TIR protein n=1 Tax=Gloeothece verrucosa (strain PCC 7822) TaxID=497965 RepID=E0U8J8_GLOV7|nr:AAA-like domain-containing protein [Gloeothece verrucosa]ADN13744.1 TIR protein [Gloeothece verrucosa PCC 7822]
MEAEFKDNNGHRYTLEQMSERTGLTPDTLIKVFACESKVDKQTLQTCFKAFRLKLEHHDYFYPDFDDEEDLPTLVPPNYIQPAIPVSTHDTISYVERPPIESICYETLQQPGALLRIKAPSLMGKTLLISRILGFLGRLEYRTIRLSLELADRKTHLTQLNKFLRWFCLNLSRELKVPNCLEDYWDEEGIGAKVSCTTYIEEYLLPQADSPLVLCLDDVDLLFPHPEIYEDFFGLLRSWYEKGRTRASWQKLRLVLVHSTNVYIRLNINQSPFNVGIPIELSDFTEEQVQQLAQQYNLEFTLDQIQKLMGMIGGHPYLLIKMFAYLKSYPNFTLEQVLQEAPTDAGIYGSHLREFWFNLQTNPELATVFKKIVSSTSAINIEPVQAYQLHSMGLVELCDNYVKPRYNLYRLYFSSHLKDM